MNKVTEKIICMECSKTKVNPDKYSIQLINRLILIPEKCQFCNNMGFYFNIQKRQNNDEPII